MLFVTVPWNGKLLLEFESNSGSQSLGRIWRHCGGRVQKRTTKKSPHCTYAWNCYLTIQSSQLCGQMCKSMQWLGEEVVNFSLRRFGLLAVWVTTLEQLICEAGMPVIDIFKTTWTSVWKQSLTRLLGVQTKRKLFWPCVLPRFYYKGKWDWKMKGQLNAIRLVYFIDEGTKHFLHRSL